MVNDRRIFWIDVWSRHLVDRIEGESVWLGSPAFADELVRRQPAESLQSTGVVIRVDEIREMSLKLAVVVVMKAFDGGFLDRAIHSLKLAVRLRMAHLDEVVFEPVLAANAVEDARVQGAVGELNAIVGQHGVDPVGRRLDRIAQKLRRLHLACPLLQSQMREFRRAVNGDKEVKLAESPRVCRRPST